RRLLRRRVPARRRRRGGRNARGGRAAARRGRAAARRAHERLRPRAAGREYRRRRGGAPASGRRARRAGGPPPRAPPAPAAARGASGGAPVGAGLAILLPGVGRPRLGTKLASRRCETLLEAWAEPWAALAWRLGLADERPALALAWRGLLQNQAHDSLCGCSL